MLSSINRTLCPIHSKNEITDLRAKVLQKLRIRNNAGIFFDFCMVYSDFSINQAPVQQGQIAVFPPKASGTVTAYTPVAQR